MKMVFFRLSFVVAALVSVIALAGCVERELTINTEPQGGLVFLNDEEIGTSPVTVSFSWYGDYSVRVSKEGYETLNTHRKLDAPLHDRFPLDFFADILWPADITDSYDWTFKLKKYQAPDRKELLEKAEAMKQEAAYDLNM